MPKVLKTKYCKSVFLAGTQKKLEFQKIVFQEETIEREISFSDNDALSKNDHQDVMRTFFSPIFKVRIFCRFFKRTVSAVKFVIF